MVRPLCYVLVAYVLGILVSYWWQPPLIVICGVAVTAFLLVLGGEITAWEKRVPYFLVVVAALGMFIYQWNEADNRGNIAFMAGKQVVLEGTISDEPDLRPNMVNYTFEVETAAGEAKSLRGKILVTVREPAMLFHFGDRLRIRGIPELPDGAGNPGEFDYARYLQTRGIQLLIKSQAGTDIEKIGTGSANPVVGFCLGLKLKLVSVLAQTLSPSHRGLMEGILLGSYGLIPPETRTDFALTGVVHILSVSGYHVGLVTAACLFTGSALGCSRKLSSVLTVAVMSLYVIMTGANPPVIRAAFMAGTLLLASLTDRKYDWPSAMSLAALLILIFSPHALFNAGFQLSFAATWGILYLNPVIQRLFTSLRFTPAAAVGRGAAAALAAQLAVIPIAAYYFNYISLVSLPANLIVVPLVSLAMFFGGVAVIAGLCWLPLAGIINVSTGLILDLILGLVQLFASVPYAVIYIKQPSIPEILIFYLALFLSVEAIIKPDLLLRARRTAVRCRKKLVGGAVLGAGLILWGWVIYPADLMEVTFLDIGQGDAILAETPRGRKILIDTGGASGQQQFQPGERILLPYLRRQGIRELDVLLLTHPHADHIQGAKSLLGNINVGLLVINSQFCQNPEGMRMVEAFKARGTEIHNITGGEEIAFDEDITLKAFYPVQQTPSSEGINNDSIIACLCYGEFEVLLTGDAEEPALRELSALMDKIDVEIVKVPHHGSKNAWCEEFYRTIGGKVAIISVGRNYFGHPSGEVLAGLDALGARVYRTDLNGAVLVTSDGHNYEVRTLK